MEFVFNAMNAFNQAGWIFGGLIMLGIGGACLAGDFYYRFSAAHFKAKITGVRVEGNPNANFKSAVQSSELYYPVYEYQAPNGETITAESNSGSSLLLNKEPGKIVHILVLPHKPLQALEEGYSLLVIGLLFAGVAAGLFSIAFHAYHTSYYTLIALAAFIVAGISKFVTKIKPRAEWGKVEEWQAARQKEFAEKRAKLRLLTTDEYYKVLAERDQLYKKWMPVYILIAFVLLGIGYFTGADTWNLAATGIHVPGEVTGIDSHRDSDGHTMYRSVVGFKTMDGRSMKFTEETGASTPLNQPGEEVQVLYDPGSPGHAIIDRGLWNWAVPALTFIPGLFVLISCLKSLAGISRRQRRR